jgi:hypothetical protein
MSIVFIQYPYVFTNNGKRLNINEIAGHIKVGAMIEEVEGKYKIVGNYNDSECVSGVCPIR